MNKMHSSIINPQPGFLTPTSRCLKFKTEFEPISNGLQILINTNRKSKSRAFKHYIADDFTPILLKKITR